MSVASRFEDDNSPVNTPDALQETGPIKEMLDDEPDTIATPEGDGEYAPTEPLTGDDLSITRPPGDEPHSRQPERPALAE